MLWVLSYHQHLQRHSHFPNPFWNSSTGKCTYLRRGETRFVWPCEQSQPPEHSSGTPGRHVHRKHSDERMLEVPTAGWGCRTCSQLCCSLLTGLHQLEDNNSCRQTGASNAAIFSKTGSSSNSCAWKAIRQCTKKHRKCVVLPKPPCTRFSPTGWHSFLPSICLPSTNDTVLMSEWLSTSPCYSMPWIRLPKLQCQAKHLQLISFAWNGIRREKQSRGCSRNHFCLQGRRFSQLGEKNPSSSWALHESTDQCPYECTSRHHPLPLPALLPAWLGAAGTAWGTTSSADGSPMCWFQGCEAEKSNLALQGFSRAQSCMVRWGLVFSAGTANPGTEENSCSWQAGSETREGSLPRKTSRKTTILVVCALTVPVEESKLPRNKEREKKKMQPRLCADRGCCHGKHGLGHPGHCDEHFTVIHIK